MSKTTTTPVLKVEMHPGCVIEYKHKIEPIKQGDKFLPNTAELNNVRKTSHVNMLTEDFIRHQEKGNVIIINFAGGWCFLTDDMKIVN